MSKKWKRLFRAYFPAPDVAAEMGSLKNSTPGKTTPGLVAPAVLIKAFAAGVQMRESCFLKGPLLRSCLAQGL